MLFVFEAHVCYRPQSLAHPEGEADVWLALPDAPYDRSK